MDIQLASDIKDILMEDGMVAIPGFGGFTSTYKPAVTDGVMGILHPPTYHLNFDPNQQANDGKLVEYIREKYHITSIAAQDTIDAYVKDIQSNFEKNEIVILPEIGRLYLDFTKKIQFLPESTNFNADTFGLTTINYSPVSRTKPEPYKAAPVALTTSVNEGAIATNTALPEPQPAFKEKVDVAFLTPVDDVPPPTIFNKPNEKNWLPQNWRNYAPAVAVGLLILLAILIWMNTRDSNTKGGGKLENEKPKVNVSPRTNNSAQANSDVTTSKNGPKQPILPPQKLNDSTAITNQQFYEDKKRREAIAATTAKPNVNTPTATNKVIVVIGGFANKSNIERLKKWITEQGYGVYEKKKSGGITEVGCEIGYESKEEYNKIIKKIKARYGNDIDIYKR